MHRKNVELNLNFSLYRTDSVKIHAGYSADLHQKTVTNVLNDQELESRRNEILSNPLYQEKMSECWNQVVDSALSPIYDEIYKQGFSDQFNENSQGLRTAGAINGYGLGLHEGLDLARDAILERLPEQPHNENAARLRRLLFEKINVRERRVLTAIQQELLLTGHEGIPRLIPPAYQIDRGLERACKHVNLVDDNYLYFKNQFLNLTVPTTFKETFADSVIAFQETQLNPRDSQIEVIHSIGVSVEVSLSPVFSRLKPLRPLFNNVDFGFTTSLHKELNSDSFLKFKNGWNANFSLQFKTRQAVSLKVQEKDICQIDLSYEIRPSSSSNIRVDCLFNSLFTQSKSEVKNHKAKSEFKQQTNQAISTSNFASLSHSNFFQPPISQNSKFYHAIAVQPPYYHQNDSIRSSTLSWLLPVSFGALILAVSAFFSFLFFKRKNKEAKTPTEKDL